MAAISNKLSVKIDNDEQIFNPADLARMALAHKTNLCFNTYLGTLPYGFMFGYGVAVAGGAVTGGIVGGILGSGGSGIGALPGALIGVAVGGIGTALVTMAVPASVYIFKWKDSQSEAVFSQFSSKITGIAKIVDPDLIDPISLAFPLDPVCIKGSTRIYNRSDLEAWFEKSNVDGFAECPITRVKFTKNDIFPSPFGMVAANNIASQVLSSPNMLSKFSAVEKEGLIAMKKDAEENIDKYLTLEVKNTAKLMAKKEMDTAEYLRRAEMLHKVSSYKIDMQAVNSAASSATATAAQPQAAPNYPTAAATAAANKGQSVKDQKTNK